MNPTSSSLLHRRRLLAALALSPLAALAQKRTWPERSIRMLVGWPPGGSADTVARLLADRLGQRLHQPVVVENRPGASGRIAALAVAQAEPDGYTVLCASPSEITIATATVLKMPYDIFKDLQPVTQVVSGAFVLLVDPKLGFNTVAELVAYGKANPGKLNYASFGNNTTNHIYGAQFCAAAGIDALHVPYKGGAPAWNDLIAGQVQLMFDNAAVVMPQVRAGKMKALAVLSPERIKLAPSIPTIAEAGYPGIGFRSWQGLMVPANTPAAIVNALHDDVAAVLATPEFSRLLEERGMPANSSTPAEFAAVLRTETAGLKTLVQRLGLKLE
ncbi:MAG TPA: tripartite tricarboxylate transporter substrate binding protein [Ramlibacter sp.]|nr:tripartite tricarboxylate transporter substrate binding protein [Ramlibacter sp.]